VERCERVVQELLCRLGEPIKLFDEREMERRDHLRALMVHLEAEGKVDLLLHVQEDDQATAGGGADPVPLLQ
jgi:U4/U6 small nuclear ribonucleoprotein PRP4